MDIKTILKTSVAAGALFAFAAPVSDAEAGNITNANSKATVSIGGRIHRALASIDDGVHDEFFNTDGTTGDSEMWLSGSGALTESITVKASLRWDIAKNEATCNFGSTTGEGTCADAGNADKYENIAFVHKSMGTLTIGDVEPGADGTMDARYVSAMFNDGAAAARATNITSGTGTFQGAISDHHAKIDPGSGANKIRWDSPSFSGLTIGADYRQDGGGSIGLKYAGKMGGMDFKAGAGYDNEDNTSMIGGHIAVKHASGFNIAYNYGKKRTMDASSTGVSGVSAAADDPSWWRLIGGYQATMNSFGQTDIHLEYAESDTNAADGNEAEVIRIGITQALDSIGAKMGLDYARIEFSDAAATDFNDIDAVVFETTFNF